MDGRASQEVLVLSGVPQGTVLGRVNREEGEERLEEGGREEGRREVGRERREGGEGERGGE